MAVVRHQYQHATMHYVLNGWQPDGVGRPQYLHMGCMGLAPSPFEDEGHRLRECYVQAGVLAGALPLLRLVRPVWTVVASVLKETA